MKKEFCTYEQALALKELGFKKECFGYYDKDGDFYTVAVGKLLNAPLYQQAFRWLYQKLDIEKGVMPLDTESQQLLLKELIDTVSSKHLLV